MEKILVLTQEFGNELSIGLLGLVFLLVFWLLLLGLRVRRAQSELKQFAADQSMSQYNALSEVRQELGRTITHGNSGLQEAMHREITALMARFEQLQKATTESLSDGRLVQSKELAEIRQNLTETLSAQRESFEQRQTEAIKDQHASLTAGMAHMSKQLGEALSRSSEELSKRVDVLTQTTENRLQEISGQVEKRLTKGFEKTTETFTKVLEHLSRIDEAQKKITELSTNVVSLQEVLSDKRSRGAFGEVQLSGLIRNLMPEGSFAMQHTLSNGTRVDCLLYLPDPTGNVPIDAKFPLESFKRMMDNDLAESDRKQASSQFRQDIRKHINDISDKYLIPGETSEGAIMFLPAEAVFAELHAHYPDLVEQAQHKRVWLVSPTTLMAILTTARAVLKDEATREQVHIIQDHLRKLSGDFSRFRIRMDNLARHIRQAQNDVEEVNTSAQKISNRFDKIEQVELDEHPREVGSDKKNKLTED